MPGRSFNPTTYKYGFNGKEKDDEVKGNGNSYDFGARIYDPRIGRWLAVDPLAHKYPTLSPFSFVANSPISFVDHDGESIRPTNSIARTTLSATFDKVFESFPEISAHVKYVPIGLNSDGVAVNAFVYAPEKQGENSVKLDYANARKLIRKSELSTKEKLVALTILKGLNSKDVHEVQQPMDPKGNGVDYGISLDAKVTGVSKSMELESECKPTGEALFAETGGDEGFLKLDFPKGQVQLNIDGFNKSDLKSMTNIKSDASVELVKSAIVNAVGGDSYEEKTNKKGQPDENGNYKVINDIDSNGTVNSSKPEKK